MSFLTIDGTYVVFSYRWHKCRVLAIGGTYVDLIEGGTNVGGTNVGGTYVGGTKVAASLKGLLAFRLLFLFKRNVFLFL